jgi:hypothetical protein
VKHDVKSLSDALRQAQAVVGNRRVFMGRVPDEAALPAEFFIARIRKGRHITDGELRLQQWRRDGITESHVYRWVQLW